MAKNGTVKAGMKPAAKGSQASDIIKGLLDRFPKAPSKTLARKAYNDNPQLWTDLEGCRRMVREYRGNGGAKHREYVADKSRFRPSNSKTNPFPKLPTSIKRLDPWGAFQIDTPGKCLILSDIHLPFHDEEALEIALKEGEKHKVVSILLNGDVADFYRISTHLIDQRVVDLWEEIESVRQFLEHLRRRFPKAEIYYVEGNHEVRLTTFMMVKAPELLDIPEFQYESLMHLKQHGITYIKDKRPTRLGKLFGLHGHEMRQGLAAPVNPARGLFLRAKVSAFQSHVHRSSHHSEPTLAGHLTSCWSIGCLCQLDPHWLPINNWNHGFAICDIGKQGEYEFMNYRIVGGRAWL